MTGDVQGRDLVFHGVRILLVVAALLATAWPMQRLRQAAAMFDRAFYATSWGALVAVSFASVVLMLVGRRRRQTRPLQAVEAVVALVLTVAPSGFLGFDFGPRWLTIALLGQPVQPLATAWLAIVLTRPAIRRVPTPKSGTPADTIVDR